MLLEVRALLIRICNLKLPWLLIVDSLLTSQVLSACPQRTWQLWHCRATLSFRHFYLCFLPNKIGTKPQKEKQHLPSWCPRISLTARLNLITCLTIQLTDGEDSWYPYRDRRRTPCESLVNLFWLYFKSAILPTAAAFLSACMSGIKMLWSHFDLQQISHSSLRLWDYLMLHYRIGTLLSLTFFSPQISLMQVHLRSGHLWWPPGKNIDDWELLPIKTLSPEGTLASIIEENAWNTV